MPRPPPPAAAFSSTDSRSSSAVAAGFRRLADAAVGSRAPPECRLLRGALGLDLSPISRICSGFGPMKVIAVLGEDFGKPRILGEESVAGMHGVGTGDLAGGEHRGHVQVAVPGWRRADAYALVGERTCMASRSAVECTATVWMPSPLQARSTRRAISPRLAIRILSNRRLLGLDGLILSSASKESVVRMKVASSSR